MAAPRRGYLVIALFGLVAAGLLSLVAVYLSMLLIWVLVEMALDPSYRYAPLYLIAPVYLAAAFLPLRAVWLYWTVLSGRAEPSSLRPAAWRLLAWTAGILGTLAVFLIAVAAPTERTALLATLMGMFGVAALIAGPMLVLLLARSPIGRTG